MSLGNLCVDGTHNHTPNGLGARSDSGLMVCGKCGREYDDEEKLSSA